MSAICGEIAFKGQLNKEAANKMMTHMREQYVHDKVSNHGDDVFFMGHLMQVITHEDQVSSMPLVCQNLVIVFDGIIDNRQELAKGLGLSDEELKATCDAGLVLKAYEKYGDEFVHQLIGDYGFAIWNKSTRDLLLVRDHVGKRSLYYTYDQGKVLFATVYDTILASEAIDRELNDQWFYDYLGIDLPIHAIDFTSTPYRAIKQVPPGHYVRINKEGLKCKRYWNPLKDYKWSYNRDDEAYLDFKKIFEEAIKCRIRTSGEVGVLLSSGLDSSAVGVFAAEALQTENRALYGYTSVPFEGFDDNANQWQITNEFDLVKQMADKYSNLKVVAESSMPRNAYNTIDNLLDMTGYPYKIARNLFWLDYLNERMVKDHGCKVVLDGQLGNFTISYGIFEGAIINLVKTGKWLKANKEIKAYAKRYNRSVKSIYKHFMIKFTPKWVKALKGIESDEDSYILLNRKACSEKLLLSRYKKAGFDMDRIDLQTLKKKRKNVDSLQLLSNIGEMETRLALKNGVLKRDPTRDKRVLEFCLNAPDSIWVSDGYERKLVREITKGMLPEDIRSNFTLRGRQSADWLQRLIVNNEQLIKESDLYIDRKYYTKYLDYDIIKLLKNQIEDNLAGNYELEVRKLLDFVILHRFLDRQDL